MKKIFTLLLCSALFAGSCWGTEITIGGNGSNDSYTPFNLSKAKSSSQSIYTAAELTAAGLPSGAKISQIDFKYGSNNSSYIRNLKVYITNKEASVATTYLSNYKFDKVTSSDLYYDSTITLPSTSATFYSLVLKSNFVWDGSSNICVIVCDYTNSAESTKYHKTSSVSANSGRCIYANEEVKPTTSGTYVGYKTDYRPIIKFTYTTGGGGGTTPKITLNESSVTLGTFDAQYEKDSATFVVKGSDLEGDITLSPGTGLEVFPSSITKAAIETAGESGVMVKVRTMNTFAFNSPKITLSSTNAESKQVTVSGTQASYGDPKISIQALKQASANSYCTLSATPSISNVDVSNKQFTISQYGTIVVDYSKVGGSYAVNGKISNLKGKLINENLFQAFAFTYSAPVVSGITINENADNTAILEQYNGQTVDVTIKRTFKKGMYNTICLPITVTHSTLQGKFGYEMSLIELSGSSYKESTITLEFNNIDGDLVAGKPYLLKPSTEKDVENPVFSNYEVSKAIDTTTTTYVDYIPLMSPTELPQSKEILFMGQNNELFWPEEAGTMKGLRCYFKVKFEGTPIPAGAPVRMVVNKDNTTTGLMQNAECTMQSGKVLRNGQLIIIRDGHKFNAQGQEL